MQWPGLPITAAYEALAVLETGGAKRERGVGRITVQERCRWPTYTSKAGGLYGRMQCRSKKRRLDMLSEKAEGCVM